MIVLYSQPNLLKLPYEIIKKVQARDKNNSPIINEKTDKPKLIEKKSAEYFTFVPGRNNISKELWVKIYEYNLEDMEFYSSILKPFKPIVDKETQLEVGTDESKLDIIKLKTRDMITLITNTMNTKDLNTYKENEKKRDKPRKAIMDAIKNQIVLINEVDEALVKD